MTRVHRLAALALFIAGNAIAADSGFYFSGRIGYTDVDSTASADRGTVISGSTVGISTDGLPFDDEDVAWGLGAGYRVNRHVALQVGYTDLGNFRSDPILVGMIGGGLASVRADTQVEEWSLSSKFSFPLTQKISANWLAGISHNTFDTSGGFPAPPVVALGDPAAFGDLSLFGGQTEVWQSFQTTLLPFGGTYGTNIGFVRPAAGIQVFPGGVYQSPDDEIGYLWGFGFEWKIGKRLSIDANYIRHEVQVFEVDSFNLGLIYSL